MKKVKIELKKNKKGSCKLKTHKRESLSGSDSSWSVGLDSTGELVHIANVARNTNKRKIESYPTNPIKPTPLDVNHTSFLEKTKTS